MKIIDVVFSEVPKFGVCKFTHTDMGWVYQYDKVLALHLDEIAQSQLEMEGYDEPPYFIDEYEPTGEYVPELSEDSIKLGVFRFYDTYAEVFKWASYDLMQMSVMGLVACYE